MFARSFIFTVSRHREVQRAFLCRNVCTALPKSLEQTTYYKRKSLNQMSNETYFPYSTISNKDSPKDSENIPTQESQPLTRAQKLKKAVAEYGTTVIVFHVSISLISLGTCYLLVSSGLDIKQVLVTIGLTEWFQVNSAIMTNAGTFAVAYAIHKVFAPVRISITLASVPFIVRYLRLKEKLLRILMYLGMIVFLLSLQNIKMKEKSEWTPAVKCHLLSIHEKEISKLNEKNYQTN